MGTHYAVELFFDPSADAAVRSIWRSLADGGVPSAIQDMGSHPHVSVAVTDELDVARFRPVLESLARETPALELALASVGLFPTSEGVVFLAPAVTRPLLDFHAQFHAQFQQFGGRSWPYYLPGNWVPHCTLAMGVSRESLPEALHLCLEAPLPIRGRIVQAALVEYRPVNVLYAFDLRTTG
jgi:2'-5' RNA ligase